MLPSGLAVDLGLGSYQKRINQQRSEVGKWLSTVLFKEPQKEEAQLLSGPGLNLPHKFNLYKNIQLGGPG